MHSLVLALALSGPADDLDQLLASQVGQPATVIVDRLGEPSFAWQPNHGRPTMVWESFEWYERMDAGSVGRPTAAESAGRHACILTLTLGNDLRLISYNREGSDEDCEPLALELLDEAAPSRSARTTDRLGGELAWLVSQSPTVINWRLEPEIIPAGANSVWTWEAGFGPVSGSPRPRWSDYRSICRLGAVVDASGLITAFQLDGTPQACRRMVNWANASRPPQS